MVNYRYLGNSGLKVSEITYGNWVTHASQVEDDAAVKTVHAALDAGIVDKVYVFVAPKIIGGVGAPTMVEGSGVTLLEEAVQLYRMTCTTMNGDLMIEAYTQEE